MKEGNKNGIPPKQFKNRAPKSRVKKHNTFFIRSFAALAFQLSSFQSFKPSSFCEESGGWDAASINGIGFDSYYYFCVSVSTGMRGGGEGRANYSMAMHF